MIHFTQPSVAEIFGRKNTHRFQLKANWKTRQLQNSSERSSAKFLREKNVKRVELGSSCLRAACIAPASCRATFQRRRSPGKSDEADVDLCTSNLWTASYCDAIIIYSGQIRCRTVLDLRSVPHVDVMLSHECLHTFILQVRLLTLPILECNHSRIERPAAGTTPPFWEVILSAGSIFRAQREGVGVFVGTI